MMPLMKVDVFYFWRWLLMVVCTIYWIVRLGQSLWGWYEYLWADYRPAALMRKYVAVQALRIRVHRFTLELIQIAALLVLFVAITYAHRYV
jgi:hypothetical protein